MPENENIQPNQNNNQDSLQIKPEVAADTQKDKAEAEKEAEALKKESATKEEARKKEQAKESQERFARYYIDQYTVGEWERIDKINDAEMEKEKDDDTTKFTVHERKILLPEGIYGHKLDEMQISFRKDKDGNARVTPLFPLNCTPAKMYEGYGKAMDFIASAQGSSVIEIELTDKHCNPTHRPRGQLIQQAFDHLMKLLETAKGKNLAVKLGPNTGSIFLENLSATQRKKLDTALRVLKHNEHAMRLSAGIDDQSKSLKKVEDSLVKNTAIPLDEDKRLKEVFSSDKPEDNAKALKKEITEIEDRLINLGEIQKNLDNQLSSYSEVLDKPEKSSTIPSLSMDPSDAEVIAGLDKSEVLGKIKANVVNGKPGRESLITKMEKELKELEKLTALFNEGKANAGGERELDEGHQELLNNEDIKSRITKIKEDIQTKREQLLGTETYEVVLKTIAVNDNAPIDPARLSGIAKDQVQVIVKKEGQSGATLYVKNAAGNWNTDNPTQLSGDQLAKEKVTFPEVSSSGLTSIKSGSDLGGVLREGGAKNTSLNGMGSQYNDLEKEIVAKKNEVLTKKPSQR